MIHVDEEEPSGELESQFNHRKVTFKRNKDVRSGFDMVCEIGRGKFGRVMKCSKKDTGEVFAAKFVTCARREDRRNVEREVEIMNCLKSPRILQLLEAYDNGRNEMCLVTEYIGGGELFDRVIEDEFVLTERACRVFVKQILEGVNYIHRQGIIHLDLKPENILCMSKSGNRVKIIDFGLARKFEPMKKLQILFGTPEFVAPEVVNFEPIGYSTDMWALGVITYVLVSGLSPFMGDTDLETMANVTIAEYDYEDEAFDNVSQEAKDFIDSLLVKDQTSRSSSESCLSHPWIKLIHTSESAECKEISSVTLAKDNHSLQKTAWNNRDSNYYLFDYKSKTASQLYEMNLTINPKQMQEKMEVGDGVKDDEDDQFSFFTPDGHVRRDSELTVNADGKITLRDSDASVDNVTNEGSLRKRSLEDVSSKVEKVEDNKNEENIEYVGLVKRPKTPLITTKDIEKQVLAISERKQSGCSSLPDVISSSFDTTELYASRCSLLEDNELLPPDNNVTVVTEEETEASENVIKEEFPLPDIVIPDGDEQDGCGVASSGAVSSDDDRTEIHVTPTITFEDDCDNDNKDQNDSTILSGFTSSQISEIGDECDDKILADPDTGVNISEIKQNLAKNYTVEDGFERPWDNALSTDSVCGTEDHFDDSSDISDDETVDNKSSSSSSFPSESSGIFYKAEYTPPPPTKTPPINNHLSIQNRDTYWRNFFGRNSDVSSNNEPVKIEKSRSGCSNNTAEMMGELPAKPNSMCKSKSDAKIGYSSTLVSQTGLRQASSAIDKCDIADVETSNEFITVKNTSFDSDIEQVEQETDLNESSLQSDAKKMEGQTNDESAVIPRTVKSPIRGEIFDQPWTEVGGDSPKQASSRDNLSTTISQEMQDLLTSIQSLGKCDDPGAVAAVKSKQSSPVKMPEKCTLREKNVDFESLMKEVEHQIRFSVTAELLERMANCPSIENYFLSEINDPGQAGINQPTSTMNKVREPPTVEFVGITEQSTEAGTDTFLGSPPIPDLLQTSVRQGPIDRLSKTHFYASSPSSPASSVSTRKMSSPPTSSITSPSPDNSRRRFTSLPRPSDMTGVARYQPTGKVPDMYSRVQCHEDDSDKLTDVCTDLSKVRSDIDNLCDIINNSSDKLKQEMWESESQRSSGGTYSRKIEKDLHDTQLVMKDIEHTVDSFRRHLSLPSGRLDYNENNTSNIKAKRVPYPAANQGSVSKTKDKFEVKSRREATTVNKSRGTTPFSKTRSPSPALESKKRTFSNTEHCDLHSPFSRGRTGTGSKMTLRKRSPSPVVTGKVSSFRSKFECAPTPPSTAQTIPRTYRLKSRDPQEIFCHSLSNTPPLNSPGNLRLQKLSRDNSGIISKTQNSLPRYPSASRLPNHFISLEPSSENSEVNKPKINRAQSLKTPRYFSPSDNNATQNAANYLRTMLPKKMSEDSRLKGPSGFYHS